MVQCTFCKVDNDLEPEPPPPLPPMPPPFMAPPNDFAPMMEADLARRGAGAALGIVIVSVTLLVIGGAVAMLTLRSSSSRVVMSPPGTMVTATPEPPAIPARPADAFFVDAHAVPAAFHEKLGAAPMGTHVVLYDTYAIASLQDPKRLENLDSYTYRNGKVDDGRPEHFPGTAKELSSKVFSLESVDYGLVPKLCADAMARVAISDGKVTHVYIEKEGAAVVMRVYVGSTRKSGFVEYDTKGVMKRVSK